VSSSWSANRFVCAPLTESSVFNHEAFHSFRVSRISDYTRTPYTNCPPPTPSPFTVITQLAVCDSPLSAFVSVQDCTRY